MTGKLDDGTTAKTEKSMNYQHRVSMADQSNIASSWLLSQTLMCISSLLGTSTLNSTPSPE